MEQESRTPLYHTVQEYIRGKIHSGEFKPGDKVPTEHELKSQFNVSRMTISTAMIHLAKDGLIRRIPGRGTFVTGPDERAAGLERSSSDSAQEGESALNVKKEEPSRRIGLIMPTIDSMFAMRIVNSVQYALNDSGYSLVVGMTNNSKKQERDVIRSFIESGVDGQIIFPVDEHTYNEEILSLKLQGYPFVLIDRYLPGVETNFVGSDNQAGAQLAVSHLWELGHREIAVCSGIDFPAVTIRDRLDGYVKELTARGALINPSLMLSDIDIKNLPFDSDHPLFRYIKARHATGYLALHSSIALLIYQAAKACGLRIPEDISIVSFDNPTSLQDEFAYFTYVDQSEEASGRRAAEMIVKLLQKGSRNKDREADPYARTIIAPTLKINHSTGVR
ncbi:GntR family transcriptional regulator [Paenibacillus nasutitermitis]|uniref:Arabinose metabolism transcriptional repressor n=1 Tax=Paenibacillus nasutitermitis TaxID=1652958 RepID=A0A916ZDM2_9BACL|nr:GntR family transcriptional regulator [Paenibacillus nasutitermitis]GGD88859.1 arabinose metabolism transcriptional repressor [Paenibacillus nasutitermitis]